MGMQVPGVPVSGHQHLEARPSFLGKLQSDGVGLLQCHRLFWREGLHVLVEVHALRLAIGALGGQKFLKGIAPLPELMDRKKRDIMERKGDKEDENKRQKQQKESSAAAL